MGHAVSASIPASRCCQEDQIARFPIELDTDCECARSSEDSPVSHRLQCEPVDGQVGGAELFQSFHYRQGHPWGCCKAADEPSELEGSFPQPLESLSYLPMRFDEGPTIDMERSHARYSKIVVHTTRARTQRRSKAWEDWTRRAVAGRAVVLLKEAAPGPAPEAEEASASRPSIERLSAMYHLDRSLSRFSIFPASGVEMTPMSIMVETIQVICPASDFLLLFDQVEPLLDEAEKRRAVMIQYVPADSAEERQRVCFLEQSEEAKDQFVQSLTALWLEKRNDHSMWF